MSRSRTKLYRKCTSCGVEKPVDEKHFHYGDRKRGYFKAKCAECLRKKHNEYYAEGRQRTEEQRERLRLVAKIKRAAQAELIKRHRYEYDLIYAQLLKKANLELKRYDGLQL